MNEREFEQEFATRVLAAWAAQTRREKWIVFASMMSEILLWVIILAVGAGMAMGRMFGSDWPKRVGDALIERWLRPKQKPEEEDQD